MNRESGDSLPDILAGLRALAADLQNDAQVGDDGIPVLTAAVASPTRPEARSRAVGAPLPTLSAVVARPAKEAAPDMFEASKGEALSAQIRATAITRRVDALWRAAGNGALDPVMMAALERALTEALQEPT